MQDQPLPRNDAAERGLICCLLLWPEEVLPAVVDRLGPSLDAFTDPDDKGIYWASQQLSSRGLEVDVVSVISEICKVKGEDNYAHWSHVVRGRYSEIPSAASYETYLETVADCSMRRQLIHSLDGPVMGLYDQEEDLEEIKSSIVSSVEQCSATITQESKSHVEQLMELDDELKSGGLITGYTTLDTVMRGILPTDFMIVAGRSGECKSHWLTGPLITNAERGNPVGVVHLEMEAYEYTERIVASKLKMNSYDVRPSLRTNDAVRAEMQRIEGLPIHYAGNLVMGTADIYRWAKRAIREYGIKVLIIDHMHLIKRHGRDANKEFEIISNELKEMKKKLGIPVIALAQFNKSAYALNQAGTNYIMPKRDHIISSSTIVNNATKILILHRTRGTVSADQAEQDLIDAGEPVKLVMNLTKNRGGAERMVFSRMWLQHSTIDDSRVDDEIVEELSK
jgi:replicative DNA helicase